MEQRLEVIVSVVDGVASIRPEGVLDIGGAGSFEGRIRAAVECDHKQVVIDLRKVTFLDSIGLRSLFRACHWCERGNVELSIVAPGGPAQRLLRVTGADAWLPVVEDVPPAPHEPVPA
jgi:anti-anti-sigma factor